MKRVMIVGGSGSGKSTLARAVGDITGLPIYHMDRIHWQAGWKPRATKERLPMALAIENSDAWIFEGGFSKTYDHRAQRADSLLWIDLPVGLRMWRVTKRLFQHWGHNRPDMADGCKETIHAETLTFYRWIWDTRHSHRDRLKRLIDDHPHLNTYRFSSPREVTQYLRDLREAQI